MPAPVYTYSAERAPNPLRFLRALWRSLRDPSDTDEVAILQTGLLRMRIARRFVRPDAIVSALARDPRTAERLRALVPCQPIDLAALALLPPGTLGRAVADHLVPRGINPNLASIPTDGDENRVLHHLYGTHDVWHVVTGFGNDVSGEMGLGAFYAAQLGAPAFLALLHAMLLMNAVFFRPEELADRMAAFASGWAAGGRAEPLFGVDWTALWDQPIADVRVRLGLVDVRVIEEGIPLAA